MSLSFVNSRGLILLGCGKMGSAMLEGWLSRGLSPSAVTVVDPYPSARLEQLATQGLRLNQDLPKTAAICVVAVKPQMMGEALPQLADLGRQTIVLSIAAGTSISYFERALGSESPIIRAMPNTPAAIGRGISALIGNKSTTPEALELAELLLSAVGRTVRLNDEAQIDAVTGLSGSGPAYVFHMIEAMTEAGIAEGLSPDLAAELAQATVAGAAALADAGTETPEQLRRNVTSPAGTTAAGLDVLMDDTTGLGQLMRKTVAAAAVRSRELDG